MTDMKRVSIRLASLLLLLLGAAALTACGSGGGSGGSGGGGTTTVAVSGRIVRAESNLPPSPEAVVTIAGQSQTTVAGTFSLTAVPITATTMTITATGASPRTVPLTLTAGAAAKLGDVYISDVGYNAIVTGRIVTKGTAQPVGGAIVKIAGVSVLTKTDGTFQIDNLPVDLGFVVNASIGTVTASGFTDYFIVPQFPLAAGANPLGDLAIGSPISSTTPLPPYTITGLITSGGQPAAGVTVTLSLDGASLGTTQTDANGAYSFWVAGGAYIVSATGTGGTKQVTATVIQLDIPVTAPVIAF